MTVQIVAELLYRVSTYSREKIIISIVVSDAMPTRDLATMILRTSSSGAFVQTKYAADVFVEF